MPPVEIQTTDFQKKPEGVELLRANSIAETAQAAFVSDRPIPA
jgi:hypothetical protein